MATASNFTNAGTDALDEFGLNFVLSEELAEALLYSGPTGGFRNWCRQIGIRPVPGRRNVYDPKQVRHALDVAQGIVAPSPKIAEAVSLVEQRRARRAGA